MDKRLPSCYTFAAPREMLKITTSAARLFLVGAFLLSSCRYPKYANYTAVNRDFKCLVPFSWNVMTESDGTAFSQANFIGPFHSDFYLGVPSFSVRWYGRYKPHVTPDHMIEMYASVDDYIKQLLSGVYPKRQMKQPVDDLDLGGGRKAKYFVVLSPAPVLAGSKHWGLSKDIETKEMVNLRQHAYVIFPMDGGFYVLIYPATKDGFHVYEKEFNQLVRSFTPLTNGPQGSVIAQDAAKPAPIAPPPAKKKK